MFWTSPSCFSNMSTYFNQLPLEVALQTRSVHLYAQLWWLHDGFRCNVDSSARGVYDRPQSSIRILNGIENLHITIRRQGWKYYDSNGLLFIHPFNTGHNGPETANKLMLTSMRAALEHGVQPSPDPFCWGMAFMSMPKLQRLVIDLEVSEDKKEELEAIVQWAKTWRFPRHEEAVAGGPHAAPLRGDAGEHAPRAARLPLGGEQPRAEDELARAAAPLGEGLSGVQGRRVPECRRLRLLCQGDEPEGRGQGSSAVRVDPGLDGRARFCSSARGAKPTGSLRGAQRLRLLHAAVQEPAGKRTRVGQARAWQGSQANRVFLARWGTAATSRHVPQDRCCCLAAQSTYTWKRDALRSHFHLARPYSSRHVALDPSVRALARRNTQTIANGWPHITAVVSLGRCAAH